jgi:hypothetical protein
LIPTANMQDIEGVNEKAGPMMDDPNIHSNSSRELSDTEKADIYMSEDVKGASPDVTRPTYTQAEEDAVIRQLDWHLMPLIFVLYSLSVLDRANLGNARISGMDKDIDLSGNRYSWLGTVFYISCKFRHYSLPMIGGTDTCPIHLTPSYRYLVSMDANWLEGFSTSQMGSM